MSSTPEEWPGGRLEDDAEAVFAGIFVTEIETRGSCWIRVMTLGYDFVAQFDAAEVYSGQELESDQRRAVLDQLRQRLAIDYGVEPDDLQVHEIPR